MLFRNQYKIIRRFKNNRVALPILILAIVLAISACTATKGSIVILEDLDGTGFTMDFREWSDKNKCELSLNKNDEIQIEVVRENGEIALALKGKNGSEPYTGNNLESCVFTVTVSEKDDYIIQITGKDATGKVKVNNLGNRAE
ncbi:MAG: hypothetical protein GX896_09325 [Clostridiales bacterium]|jgi:hypothetical protein|nr:hypothetical protein [Clostridiales bacterium]